MEYPRKLVIIVLVVVLISITSFALYFHYNSGFQNITDGKITFTETGLASETSWTVKATSIDYSYAQTTNSTSMVFANLRNGVYTYYIAQESGYTLQQSGQATVSGYSGTIYLGDIGNTANSGFSSYPSDLKVNLNFTPVTPQASLMISNASSQSDAFYFVYVNGVTAGLGLSQVKLTLINAQHNGYSIILSSALNNKTTLAGTWNVTVTGPNYLSGSTGINIREKTPDALYDPFLNQIKLIDLRTNGVIASLTV